MKGAQKFLTSTTESMQRFGESPVGNYCHVGASELKIGSLKVSMGCKDNPMPSLEIDFAFSRRDETTDNAVCVNAFQPCLHQLAVRSPFCLVVFILWFLIACAFGEI